MPELRVVAVSNDGTRLVLKAADSTEYTLPIDERLRAVGAQIERTEIS